ncbi:hypothetical protein YWIDRAFT_08412 [Streptomyces sp. SceaMP-e96]|nr:hypothetical protein YWIDRAFT_08412 [Streptomyces sp. SceaMP-e96]
MGGTVAEEVGPYGKDHAQSAALVARGQQSLQEDPAFRIIAADGEQLFELIHQQPGFPGPGGRLQTFGMRHGVCAGGEDAHSGRRLVGGTVCVAQAGDEPGAQQ